MKSCSFLLLFTLKKVLRSSPSKCVLYPGLATGVLYAGATYTRVYTVNGHSALLPRIFFVSTHSLDPCLWGGSDHPTFDLPASLSGQQLHHSSGVYPQIQRLGAVEEMVWVGVAEGA